MSWLLRLMAIGGLWRKCAGAYHQARSHVRQAGSFAQGVVARHVQETLERAEMGDREALFEMGERYYEGRGVPQDYLLAVTWFRQAAELNHLKAQTNLALMLWIGRGCQADQSAALRWIAKAAGKGYEPAIKWHQTMKKQYPTSQAGSS